MAETIGGRFHQPQGGDSYRASAPTKSGRGQLSAKGKDMYIKMLQKEILKHQQEAKQHREDVRELFRRVADIERRLPEQVR